MKQIKKLINKKAGASAIIGVILMVAMSVAIAATVFIYVNDLHFDYKETETVYKTGVLQGYSDYSDGCRTIYMNNENFTLTYTDIDYLTNFIGQNITLTLETYYSGDYDYKYIGAYLNIE